MDNFFLYLLNWHILGELTEGFRWGKKKREMLCFVFCGISPVTVETFSPLTDFDTFFD